jgi:hypothetical protein
MNKKNQRTGSKHTKQVREQVKHCCYAHPLECLEDPASSNRDLREKTITDS